MMQISYIRFKKNINPEIITTLKKYNYLSKEFPIIVKVHRIILYLSIKGSQI